jgi:hypothetical protein
VSDNRPDVPTVFDRLHAAGLSQERIEQHLAAGRVDGELVTDPVRPGTAARAGRAVGRNDRRPDPVAGRHRAESYPFVANSAVAGDIH